MTGKAGQGPIVAIVSGGNIDLTTVTVTEVGSMSLVARFINSATLTYTVDGVQVTKTIDRQTLVNERYAGRFSASFERKGTGSACGPGASVTATPATVEITQDTGVTNPETRFVVASSGDTCTFIGTYSQLGRFAQVSGNYSCSAGDAGTFTFLEMTRSHSDFRARTAMMTQSGCRLDGHLIGLQQ